LLAIKILSIQNSNLVLLCSLINIFALKLQKVSKITTLYPHRPSQMKTKNVVCCP